MAARGCAPKVKEGDASVSAPVDAAAGRAVPVAASLLLPSPLTLTAGVAAVAARAVAGGAEN